GRPPAHPGEPVALAVLADPASATPAPAAAARALAVVVLGGQGFGGVDALGGTRIVAMPATTAAPSAPAAALAVVALGALARLVVVDILAVEGVAVLDEVFLVLFLFLPGVVVEVVDQVGQGGGAV